MDSHEADEYALSVAPIFASRHFFYGRLLSDETDLGVRRRAAALVLELAANGRKIDYKVLVRSLRLMHDCHEGSYVPQLLELLGDDGKATALALVYQAKLEKRWDDAYNLLAQYVESNPLDVKKRIELGLLAYRSGAWGDRADAITALSDYSNYDKAREVLETVKSFFEACSISLSSPVDADRRAGVQSPGSVFRHVLTAQPPAQTEGRNGIVMIAPSLAGGGAERIAATICGHLSAQNEKVEMAIYELGAKSGRDPLFYLPMTGLGREDIEMLSLCSSPREPFSWLPPNLSRKAQAIHDFLAERRPQTLYLTLDMANLAGGFAGVIAGVPNIILHCHNQRPSDIYAGLGMEGWAMAYRTLLDRSEVRMIAVSETVAKDYKQWTGGRPGRIKVVRNGLDLRELMRPERQFLNALKAELGIPATSLVVGTAFRFEEVKRPDVWIGMAQHVSMARTDVHFVLFGDGTLFETMKLKCRELGLGDRVHFVGHVNDLYRRLPLLDVFVLSSRSEGLPNVLLEAQAAGAIPVAFDVGGCRETMIDGVTGVLVCKQSDEALANAVLRVLDDPHWRRAAKRAGRKLARSRFSARRMLAKFDKLLTGGRTRSQPATDS